MSEKQETKSKTAAKRFNELVYNILVVDDELHTREICSDLLTEVGYKVEQADNGKNALELLPKNSFQILLTDLQMPEMDGMALLKESKKLFPDIEVILMTAYAGLPSAIEAIRFGAYDYVTKPFSGDFLINTIKRCTEKIELKQKLKESQLKLVEQEKLAALGSVSAWLSHRMRNSLSVISMCAHYLKEKLEDRTRETLLATVKKEEDSLPAILHSPLDSKQSVENDFKEVTSVIIDKIKTIEKMTSDFISYSRSYEPKKCNENLNVIIANVLEPFVVPFQIKKIRLTKKLDSELPLFLCDSHSLREVFENILINALEAIQNQENQTLIVKTEKIEQEDKGTAIVVSISNSGSEIPEENRDKIFTPFFTTKENGSGLGLAIIKKIVELHGGRVSAESKEEDGQKMTTIKTIFPV